MNVCAVIAEYNPFHNGHALHLKKCRELTQADCVLVLMSGFYTQRGEVALLPPSVRASAALREGADAVLSLPWYRTCVPAENYALHAVTLLNRLGSVRSVCFGMESGSPDLLSQAARLMEEDTVRWECALKERLKGKLSYPRAVQEALADLGCPLPEIRLPNTILALTYLRALIRTQSPIRPVAVRRTGDYHSLQTGTIPSASSLRAAWRRGDWDSLRRGMPAAAFELFEQAVSGGLVCDPSRADVLLLRRLSGMEDAELKSLPDMCEGMENRLRQAAIRCRTRQEVIDYCCGEHFTRARVSRLLCSVLLGPPPAPDADPWVRLWGFRRSAAPLIGEIRSAVRCFDRFTDMKRDPAAKEECAAEELWYNCSGVPVRALYSQPLILLGGTERGLN